MKALNVLYGALVCALLAALCLGAGDVGARVEARDGGPTGELRWFDVHSAQRGEDVDASAGDPAALSLGSTPAWSAEGDQQGAHFGFGISGAGDVNGDGYPDVIIGAYAYDNGQTDEGRVFVYHGIGSGLASTPAWTFESDQAGAYLGSRVRCAGDVNGDGYSDVIVSVQHYENGHEDEGAAFVFHGSASGLSATPDWIAESNQPFAQLVAVDGAGDVNGDGYSDVIVGAWIYDMGSVDAGCAWVYYGSATGLESTPAWTAYGDVEEAYFGYCVSGAGDVNDDGYSDVIVGARGPHGVSPEGRAFVYHGSASGLSATPDWQGESVQTGTSYGARVDCAGDVNGDGYSDVIIGGTGYDNGQENEGAAWVYHGGPSGLADVPAWIGECNQEYAAFGSRVAGAGDVNNDTYSDVIVGAIYYDGGQTDEGRAYVFYGGESGLDATPAWILEMDQAGAFFGLDVAGVGDVTGDGTPDVMVGASYYDNGQDDEGVAFLFAEPPEPPPSAEPTITSILDYPQDEGKKVILNWAPSALDVSPNQVVTHYSVWRRYLGGGAFLGWNAADPADGTSPTSTLRGLTKLQRVTVYGGHELGLSEDTAAPYVDRLATAGWEYVGDSPARYLDEYAMTVPTYADSTASGIPYCAFIVMAHTEDEWTFWVSEPDTGYSVDNTPPEPPSGVAGQYMGDSRLLIHWKTNPEADISHYAVYKGVGPDFRASEANRIATSEDTSHVDHAYDPRDGRNLYYKVTAFDVNGNESGQTRLTPDDIIDVPGMDGYRVNALCQNVPNPFDLSTRIEFSLERAGNVRLMVFDVTGRLVRVLADGFREPDWYIEEWDGRDSDGRQVPPGVYMCRLETSGWSEVKRMTVAR